ncbi:phosphoribosylglycinamide formyltransferase [Prevotella corporis]|uniref:phosphoribosylglycinamide formyltransferase n=1 Tax=Prevotella corporis TaxID=28128 RepID=UPI0023EF70E9|nr:phosphoribosylglycinamide formyltransferase [Prevotella corporis]
MVNLAIFVSGSGTNCENIIRYFQNNQQVNISLVISNKADAYALVRAKHLNVETAVLPKSDFNNRELVLDLMSDHRIDFIVLAGFLLMIPDWLIDAYEHRMVNLHPALLPKFGGKGMYGHHVHESVKAAGESETGMTVHWVSNVCDGGEIIEQYKTAISPDDTPDDIAEKEHELEMEHFPKVIERVLLNEGFLR